MSWTAAFASSLMRRCDVSGVRHRAESVYGCLDLGRPNTL
jgi:hypothetical protein